MMMVMVMIYTQGKCLLGTCNGKDFFLYSSISSQNAPLIDDDNLTIKTKYNNNVIMIIFIIDILHTGSSSYKSL